MGQHHALGRAAGARGVDEAADVVAPKLRDRAVEIAREIVDRPAPASSKSRQFTSRLAMRWAMAGFLHRHDEGEIRGFEGRRQHTLGNRRVETMTPLAPLWLSTWR